MAPWMTVPGSTGILTPAYNSLLPVGRMARSWQGRFPTWIVLAVCLLLVACGSDPDGTQDGSDRREIATTTSATATAVEQTQPTDAGTSPSTTGSSPNTEVEAEEYEPQFTPGECPFEAPPGTEPRCGTFSVPENREQPDEGQIQLAVAVFPARANETFPPMVYLEGGPGGHVLETIPISYEERFSSINEERTLVLFDQRGVGFSEPSLRCPEIVELTYDLLDEALPVQEVVDRNRAVLDDCRGRWLEDGADLTSFNSRESAADVEHLRRALGFDEWDIYGVSYGTRLALTVMRDHPEGIRAVVLDSTDPPEGDSIAALLPNLSRALHRLFAACTADPLCSATYGDLETGLFSVIEQLDESPVDLWVLDIRTFEGYPARLDGDAFLALVIESLYSVDLIPRLPKLIADARDGYFGGAQSLMSLFLASRAYVSFGMFTTLECHETVPFSDPEAARSAAEAFPRLASIVEGTLIQSDRASELCGTWGAGEADPSTRRPLVSDIPTLVMAGRFDPITPPEDGQRVAERLPNAWFLEFTTLSHGVAFADDCPKSIMFAFLSEPHARPDESCIERMPETEFEVFAPSGEIELVEDLIHPFLVLVPEGWMGEQGFYQRGSWDDPTALVILLLPAGFGDATLDSVAYAFSGIDIEPSGVITTSTGKEWIRYSATAGSVSLEAALFDGPRQSVVVLLVSDPRETAALVDQVLEKVLEGFDPEPG